MDTKDTLLMYLSEVEYANGDIMKYDVVVYVQRISN